MSFRPSSRESRREARSLFLPNKELLEHRPFDSFLEREITEPRIQMMIEGLKAASSQNRWGEFSRLATNFNIITPNRFPHALCDERAFQGIFDSMQDQAYSSLSASGAKYIRMLYTFFADRIEGRTDSMNVAVERYKDFSVGLIQESRQAESVEGVYMWCADLFLCAPETRGREWNVQAEDFRAMKEKMEEKEAVARGVVPIDIDLDFRDSDDAWASFFADAANVAILQPEYFSEIPLDAEAEKAASRSLRLDFPGQAGEVQFFAERAANIALIAAEKIEVPSRGRLKLTFPSRFTQRPELPIIKEY